MRHFAAVLALVLLTPALNAFESAEELRAAADKAVAGALSLKSLAQSVPAPAPPLPSKPSGLKAVKINPPTQTLPKPKPEAGARFIRLTGSVNLTGSASAPAGASFANVMVSGMTLLYDQDGRMVEGFITVTDNVMASLAGGGMVTTFAHPYAYVAIYEGGKYLGMTRVDGTILVSGTANGGWLTLSGSGTVGGELYVPAKKKS